MSSACEMIWAVSLALDARETGRGVDVALSRYLGHEGYSQSGRCRPGTPSGIGDDLIRRRGVVFDPVLERRQRIPGRIEHRAHGVAVA